MKDELKTKAEVKNCESCPTRKHCIDYDCRYRKKLYPFDWLKKKD